MNPVMRIALELEPGQSGRFLCPFCGGGQEKEDSLSVTHIAEGGLVYVCFRDSCQKRGFVGTNPKMGIMRDKRKGKGKHKQAKPYKGPLKNPERALQEFLEWKYGITPREIALHSVSQTARGDIFLTVFNSQGFPIGGMLKRMGKFEGPKTIAYPEKINYPWMAWYRWAGDGATDRTRPPMDTTYIVEDQLSAIRMARYGDAVALLGTSLSGDKLEALTMGNRCAKVRVCLDPDAYDTAQKIVRNNRLFFKDIRAVALPRDPKDIPDGKLRAILEGI